MIRASAPGKVVLSGEYAVLDGAPAIAMAVNRRAMVTADADGNARLQCIGLSGDVDRALLDCVLRTCDNRDVEEVSWVLDTSEFVDERSGCKLGIGSSAALCVAMVQALMPDSSAIDVLQTAASAHRAFQGGVGSGIDVATAATGGVIGFSQDGPSVSALHWPKGLLYALLWSGVPASTRDKICRVDSAGERSSRRSLHAAAETSAAAWQNGDVLAIINSGQAYSAALADFSADYDLGIFASGHAALHQRTRGKDLLYKPCGAGGGDIGVALATSRAVLDAFVKDAEEEGFAVLDAGIDEDGVRIDP